MNVFQCLSNTKILHRLKDRIMWKCIMVETIQITGGLVSIRLCGDCHLQKY